MGHAFTQKSVIEMESYLDAEIVKTRRALDSHVGKRPVELKCLFHGL
jgi:hypothetical protein